MWANMLRAFQVGKALTSDGEPSSWMRSSRMAWAFADPRRVIAEDLSHRSSEKRYYCFGEVGDGILTVRFTYREGVIRIFGAGYWRRGKRVYDRENQIHR